MTNFTTLRAPTLDGAPPPVIRPRGEGPGPKSGTFWIKGASIVPITGTCNEICNLSGQAVLTAPEDFGFSVDDVMEMLQSRSVPGDAYSPAAEYLGYLGGNGGDLRRMATLWRASKIAFEMLLRDGWVWSRYEPGSTAHFIATRDDLRRQLPAVADHLPLMEVDSIYVTVATDFANLNDKNPILSSNISLEFRRKSYPGFLGILKGAIDWSRGGEAAPTNYFYALTNLKFDGDVPLPFACRKASINTPLGFRRRFVVSLLRSEPEHTPDGQVLMRIPVSAGLNLGMQITRVDAHGRCHIFSDHFFNLNPADIECHKNHKWQPIDAMKVNDNGNYGPGMRQR